MNNYNKLELLKKELHTYTLDLWKYNNSIDSRKVVSRLNTILNKVEV